MGKERKFIAVLSAAVMAMSILFLAGCSDSTSGLSDGEKAVLVNKAIQDSETSSSSAPALSLSRTVIGGSSTAVAGTYDDLASSAFYADVSSSWIVYSITYANLEVSVTDEDGNDVTVILNGSIYYGSYTDPSTFATEIIIYGTVTGTVAGEPFSFAMDIKMTVSTADGSVTITGTAGDTEINESY